VIISTARGRRSTDWCSSKISRDPYGIALLAKIVAAAASLARSRPRARVSSAAVNLRRAVPMSRADACRLHVDSRPHRAGERRRASDRPARSSRARDVRRGLTRSSMSTSRSNAAHVPVDMNHPHGDEGRQRERRSSRRSCPRVGVPRRWPSRVRERDDTAPTRWRSLGDWRSPPPRYPGRRGGGMRHRSAVSPRRPEECGRLATCVRRRKRGGTASEEAPRTGEPQARAAAATAPGCSALVE